MKNIFSILLLALSLNATAADRPEIGRYVNAYAGEENTTVYVLRLGPPKNAEALVLVRGIDNQLDGVIQKASIVNDNNSGRSYRIKQGSDEFEILRLNREQGRLLLSAQPNGLNEYRVSYSPNLSQEAQAEHLLTQWLEQGKR